MNEELSQGIISRPMSRFRVKIEKRVENDPKSLLRWGYGQRE